MTVYDNQGLYIKCNSCKKIFLNNKLIDIKQEEGIIYKCPNCKNNQLIEISLKKYLLLSGIDKNDIINERLKLNKLVY